VKSPNVIIYTLCHANSNFCPAQHCPNGFEPKTDSALAVIWRKPFITHSSQLHRTAYVCACGDWFTVSFQPENNFSPNQKPFSFALMEQSAAIRLFWRDLTSCVLKGCNECMARSKQNEITRQY